MLAPINYPPSMPAAPSIRYHQPSPEALTVEEQARAIDGAAAQIAARFDAKLGGFGPAPKFPRPAEINLLLHQHARLAAAGREEAAGAVWRAGKGAGRGGDKQAVRQRRSCNVWFGAAGLLASANIRYPSAPATAHPQPGCCTWRPSACSAWWVGLVCIAPGEAHRRSRPLDTLGHLRLFEVDASA